MNNEDQTNAEAIYPGNLKDDCDSVAKVYKCPQCGAPEIEAYTPWTVYGCGSKDYDQRPGTFMTSEYCSCHASATAKKSAWCEPGGPYPDYEDMARELAEGLEFSLKENEAWVKDQYEGTGMYTAAWKSLDGIRAIITKYRSMKS